ncbi:MAG: hypothetical protein DRR06_02220 [Gammaproteobacteria bacterium]|nr:MAG: hypothetical protein DRR06_02220 [Gammaproteobacteria bacterium]RLA53502.1 MAG: hypothetical protein DRR42_04635 [Gammaproteobacteria bacterium]
MTKKIPLVDDWYQDVNEDMLFEIVAVDKEEDFIEVQYLSGEIGEFDFDTWGQMVILKAEPPEDWRAPFEITDEDNSGTKNGTAFSVSNWDDPHTNIDPDLDSP